MLNKKEIASGENKKKYFDIFHGPYFTFCSFSSPSKTDIEILGYFFFNEIVCMN